VCVQHVCHTACKTLWLWNNDFWKMWILNTDCCFNHNPTKISYTKSSLWTKPKFNKYGRNNIVCILDSGWDHKKYSLNTMWKPHTGVSLHSPPPPHINYAAKCITLHATNSELQHPVAYGSNI
jgi:hypothetical protein